MRRRNESIDRGYGIGFEIRVLLARLNLLLENLWRAGFLFFVLCGVFVALSWMGVWPVIGGTLHVILLALFALALIYSLFRLIKGFERPTRSRALQLLEQRNTLSHRPLRSLGARSEAEEKNNTPASLMWGVYQKSLRRNLNGLKTGFPNLSMGMGDGYGIRAVTVLLLVVAFILAGPRTGERFAAAFSPDLGAVSVPLEMTAWINPPDYTGQAPILLKYLPKNTDEAGAETYVIPAGSQFTARVFGGSEETPVLDVEQESLAFERLDTLNFQIETEFEKSALVQVNKDDAVVGSWNLNVIADEKPTIELLVEPEVTERSAFRLQYRAQDDYGVAGIGGEIRRENSPEVLTLVLPTPGRGSTEIIGKSYHELTAHPWAGLEVDLRLFAEDQTGQQGFSDVTRMVLPERTFTHPIARALIEQRRNLVLDPDANKPNALIALEAIALIPESLGDDFTAMVLLSTARSTLRYGAGQQAIDKVVELLWETALRLENGDLSMAEAALRAAEQALMEALNSNASDSEIKKLVEELRAAMENFLQALAQQQMNTAEQPQTIDPESQNRMIQSQDLQKLLDKIDQFARGGARDAARELLSELQDIMENLQSAQRMQPSADQQAMQQMLNELGEMMQKQQDLLDETLRQSREGQQGQQQGGDRSQKSPQQGQGSPLDGLAQNQEALRQMLGDLMGRLGMKGEIPQSLGRAERSMKDARESLGQGEGEGAMKSESEALDNLRQGAEGLAQQMMENRQGQGPQSAGNGQRGQPRDPLGRPTGQEGPIGTSSENSNLQGAADAFNKTRSIRDEVQRRLSDPSRDLLEREYLKRLLDFF